MYITLSQTTRHYATEKYYSFKWTSHYSVSRSESQTFYLSTLHAQKSHALVTCSQFAVSDALLFTQNSLRASDGQSVFLTISSLLNST